MVGKKRNKYIISFVAMLAIVVLVSCALVGTVLAWLKWRNDDPYESEGTKLGTVAVAIVADGNSVSHTTSHSQNGVWKCEHTYSVPKGGTTRSLNLKVRNTGDIDALIRVSIRVYKSENINYLVTDTTPQKDSTSGAVSINLDTAGWFRNFGVVASGEMYLNKVLEPYTVDGKTNADGQVDIISKITVPSECRGDNIFVAVTVDAISHSGNIYKKIYEYQNSHSGSTYITTVPSTNPLLSVNWSQFTVPDGFSGDSQIPVNAFPFGATIPCDLTANPNSGWLAWKQPSNYLKN